MGKDFYYATAILVGAIVGVGIFGIPYVVAKAGFALGLFFLGFLGGIVLLLHLFYGEIVLRTQGKHRFVGYAERYLGNWGKRLSTFTTVFVSYGALLAYMIVGGKFLSTLFGGSEFFWSLVFFSLGVVAIFFGLGTVSRIEILMTIFLMVTILLVLGRGWSWIDFNNFSRINWSYFFLPYGVILWALTGWSVVPELKDIFKNGYHSLKKAIIAGSLIPLVLYFIFLFAVVGITGPETTPEAIEGLTQKIENHGMVLGALFGFFAVATSFLAVGLVLKKIFWYDYHINKHLAWFFVCLVPLLAFLFHLRDFIQVIGFLGGTLGGLEGVLLVLIYQRAKKNGLRKPEYALNLPSLVNKGIILILVLGIIYQVVDFFC